MTITIPPSTSTYTLSASGTIASNAGTRGENSQTQGVGIYITGSNDTLVNTGTIIGGYAPLPPNGVSLDAGVGVINGTGDSVTNQLGGLIEDTYSFAGGIFFDNTAGTVTNAGTIIGGVGSPGGSGDGIVLDAGGSVTNLSTGTISGGGVYAGTLGSAGTVTNSGKIIGDAVYGGVFLAAGGMITNLAGTIAANGASYGIKIGGADATITNAATITGGSASGTAIIMAAVAGNRVIDQSGGVFIGTVNGGSNATMELASPASAGILVATGTQFTNFSNLTIDSGAHWTIDGDSTLSSEFSKIAGFTIGDTISLAGLAQTPTTFSSAVGTVSGTIETSVTIKAGSTGLETLTLLGSIASNQLSFVAGSTSTLTEIPAPPTIAASGTVTFNGGGAAVAADPGLTVTDSNSATLASATVTIGGFISGDTLTVGNPGGLTPSFNSGTLTLTGTASLTTYQDALDSVEYGFTANGDPTGGGSHTSRTLTWTANNGTSVSNTGTTTVDTVHTAPTVTAGGTVTFDGGGSALALDPGLTVTDVDSAGVLSSATVTVAGAITGDTLNFTNTGPSTEGNIGVASDSGGVLVLTSTGSTATVLQWENALEAVSYNFSPSDGDPTGGGGDTSRTIDWTVNDGSTSNGTNNVATSTLNTVHIAPTITAGSTATYAPGGGAVTVDSGVTVADVDSNGNLSGATVTISAGFLTGDTLAVDAGVLVGTGISAGTFNTTSHQLTLTGSSSLTDYRTVLDAITYSSTASDPANGGADTSRTISWQVSDGAAFSATATSTVDVDVLPVIGGTVNTAQFYQITGNNSGLTLDGGITVSDPNDITSATATISSGFESGDDLGSNLFQDTQTFLDGATISANFSAGGVLTLTTTAGSASASDYQTALQGVQYGFVPAGGDPSDGGLDKTRTITWSVTDTNGATSVAGSTTTLDVYMMPVLAAAASPTETWNSGAVTADANLTVTDGNTIGVSPVATVSVASGAQGGDELFFPAGDLTGSTITGTAIVVSGNDSTTLTLTGTSGTTAAQFQTALDEVQFDAVTPNSGTRTLAWQFNDDAGGNANDSGPFSTSVDAVLGPPLTPGSVSVSGAVEGTTAGTLSAAFSDADTSDPASDFSGTIAWGDGATTPFTSADVSGSDGAFTVGGSHTYAEEGSYSASVTIDHVAGSTTTETGTATVGDAPLTAGAVSVSGAVEGVTAGTLSAAFSDANTGAPTSDFSGTIDWGDGSGDTNFTSAAVSGSNGSYAVSGSHTYAEEGNYSTTVTINDVGGSTATETATATVGDAPLTAGAVSVSGAVEGVTAGTLSAAFSDANTGAPTSDFSGTIDWGDGSGDTNFTSTAVSGSNGSYAVSGSHTYAEEGNYSTTVTINDVGGSTATETGTATVGDAPLTAGAVSVSGAVEGVTAGALSAAFSDANTGAPTSDFSGTIDWGDGSGDTNFTSTAVSGSNGSYAVSGSHTYAEEGNYSTTVTIDDEGGNTATETGTATVGDAPLTAGAVSVSGAVEGVTAGTLSAAFSDANTGAPTSDFSGTIDWGDGSGDTNFTSTAVSGSNGSYAVSGSHTYAEEGNYSTTVTINDVGGSTATETGTATVGDAPLTAGAVSVSGAVEGVTAGALSAAFSDANTGAPTSDFSGTIDWGDGSGDTNFTSTAVSGSNGSYAVSGSHTYAEEGNYSTTVTIDDEGGNTATETGTATVGDAPLTAGAVSVSGAVEGVTAGTLSAAFSDANTGAPTSDFSGTIDWGDGSGDTNFTSTAVSGSNGSYAVSGSHTYAEEGNYSTTVTISDVGGSTATETGTATVGDAPLTAGAVSVSGAVEGVTAGTLSAAFSDANTGAPTSDFSGTIDWGDGSGDTTFTSTAVSGSNGAYTVSGSHTYAEEGNYSTTVTIDDVGGSTTTETGTATVGDAPLTAGAVSVSGAVEGTTAGTLSAAFSDANTGAPASDFSGTIAWGDGNTTSFTSAAVSGSNGSYTVSGSHLYAQDGSYTATVTIDDVGGSTATETGTATVGDVPAIITAGGTVDYEEGQSAAVALDGGLTVSDRNADLSSATVRIGTGFASGDTLHFSTQNGITGSYASGTGILTLSGSATLAQYQTALRSVSFSTSSTNAGDRTIDWSAGDGTVTSASVTSTVDVTAGPSVTAGASVNYEEGAASKALDSALTLADPSNADLSSATVRVGTGFASGDTLSFTNQSGITGSYASGAGVLTLTGSATIAQYQAALRSITFSTTSTTAGGRTIDWSAGDGTVTSASMTSTVDVTAGPSVTAGASVNYEEGAASKALDSALTLADPSNADLSSATVRVGTGFASGDTLSFTNQSGITGSYASGTGVLTLTGSATLAQYQAALRSITFSTTSTTAGGRTIDWSAGDGTVTSATATSTVDVTAGPSVTAGASVNYEEGAASKALDSALTLADPSNADLSSATVRVGTGFASGDTLSFTNQSGITGSYASGTGVLTLSGPATLAQYQAALRSITFSTTSTTAGGRTIDWSAGDGTVTSASMTSTVDVTAGPSVTAGASVNYEEGAASKALDSALTLADPSKADLSSATVRVGTGFASGDTLSFTNQSGITGSYASGTGVLTLTGSATIAEYQTALRSITFSTTSTTAGGRTIDWSAGDGTVTSASVTSTVDVTAGPSVTAGASVNYEEGAASKALDSALTLADPSNADLDSATVRIGTGFASGDTLSFTNQSGITGSYAIGAGVLTLSGPATLAQYQAALRSVGFSTTSTTAGGRTIDWSAGDGTVTSASVTSTVDVTAGPSVTAGASVNYEEGAASKALDSALTLADPSNADLSSATVRVGTGFASGDTLSFTNQSGITGSYASGAGVLTLTGSATLAQYQAALRSITFSTTSTTAGGRTIDWSAGDGTVTSASMTSTVDVTAGPSVTAGASVNYEEGAASKALDSALTLADPSNADLSSATVRVGTGFASGDTLSFTNQSGITGSYASGTGVLTLTGSATIAEYQTALRSITFSTTSTTAGGRTIDWSAGDGTVTSASMTSTVDVTPPTGITSASAFPTSGILGVGKSIAITLELGRAVTVTGTPTLTLNDNGGVATYDSAASTSTALVFKDTVGTGQAAGTLAVSSVNLPNGATIRDGNGVNLNPALPASATFTGLGIDTTPPTVHAASLTVAEDSAAKAIGIAAPSDTLSLTIAVTGLPTDGTVTLAGGVTAVTQGETLTSAQLTGLEFKPTPNLYDSSSTFAYAVTDSAGNVADGSATLAILPQANPPAGLTGDGQSDLLMTENPGGALDLDELSGTAMRFTKIGGLGPEWQFEGTGQFLGDGKTGELLWDSISGGIVVAEDNAGTAKYTSIGGVGSEWQFEGDGAFLGQSTSDFLLWNDSSGVLVVGSVTNGTAQYAAIGGVGPTWQFEGVGDYLGDGKTGFLMENTSSGVLVVGEDVGGTAEYTAVGGIGPTQWTVEGTGDLLGHGQDDFLIRNTSSGALVVGEVTGDTAHYTQIGGVGSEWQFLGVGNYDGKSDAEFIMRDSTNGVLVLGSVVDNAANYTQVGGVSPTQWNFHTTNTAVLS